MTNHDKSEKQDATVFIHNSVNLVPGLLIGERFKVIELIGRGGMGSVYRIEDIAMGTPYALKVLSKEQTNDANWRRFEIETRATNKLDHPNLIKVHSSGLLPDGQPFFIMDLVAGETLAEILAKRGRLTESQLLKIFIQVGFALNYAHENGVIHRDIKPSNIMLQGTESATVGTIVRLLDFGIAKLTGQDEFNQQTLTRTGEIFGSPLYMSPEQCMGTGVDHRSDLYSVGCVMYECLTGAPPLVGENALSTMMKHQSEKPLSLKEASLGLEFTDAIEHIIGRLLEKDLNARYQSAEAFTSDLVALDQAKRYDRMPTLSRIVDVPRPIQAKTEEFSKPVLWYFAITIFLIGFVLGYNSPKYAVTKDKYSKETTLYDFENTLPPPNVKNPNSDQMLMAMDVEPSKHDSVFLKIEKEPGYFSTLGPGPNQRTFKFPSFTIGAINFGPIPKPAVNTMVMDNFKGLSFMPAPEFRQHPGCFKRFRPDDIALLDISNDKDLGKLFSGLAPDTARMLTEAKRLTGISHLDISLCDLEPQNVPIIDQFPSLTTLVMGDDTTEGKSISRLKILNQLKCLRITRMKNSQPVIEVLPNLHTLKKLQLSNCELTDSDVSKLSKAPSLENLDLSWNKRITGNSLRFLPITLKRLSMRGCKIEPKHIRNFEHLKNLRELQFSFKSWSRQDTEKLRTELPGCAITDPDPLPAPS